VKQIIGKKFRMGLMDYTVTGDVSSLAPPAPLAAGTKKQATLLNAVGSSQLVPRRGLEPPTYRFTFVALSSLRGLYLHRIRAIQ